MSLDRRTQYVFAQIKGAISQLQKWNAAISSAEDYYTTSEGMKLLAASCMLIESIGEGVNQINKATNGELLPQRPEIPWKDVIGIRNHIAHGYFDIDGEIVFDVISNDLAPLQDAVDYFLSL